MKKGKIIGLLLLTLGFVLIIFGITRLSNNSLEGFGYGPILLVFGIISVAIGMTASIIGYSDVLYKQMLKKQRKIIEANKDELAGLSKISAEISNPYFDQQYETASKHFNHNNNSLESRLLEAKSLKEKELITAEEYELLRKEILNIK